MATESKIEWTEMTWNPVTGCTKVSQGCKYCYAEVMARRLKAMGNPRYKDGFRLTLHPDLIDLPLTWKQPRTVFVNSMSDLFHERIPLEFIERVFETMNRCPQHTFQILTKRGERLAELAHQLNWTPNIWMGVSVEDSTVLDRIANLQQVPAQVRFLSCEPLLGPIQNLPLEGIHWVIVGGESGVKARPMELKWAREIHKQCRKAGVAFFLKQLGGRRGKRGGDEAILDGKKWHELPLLPLKV